MWTEQFKSMMMLLVMAALLRVSYEMSRPTRVAALDLSSKTEPISGYREREAKAVSRYAQAQGKMWRHWEEAMFEPVK